ncbi:hypothetical protein, partial [Leptolyngbya sp. BC1307]|uniref:hypothetical protein n=1 Tax=Leptolyngbya sp. BC1307 TaxID=2029589 RepID=UPI00197F5F2A
MKSLDCRPHRDNCVSFRFIEQPAVLFVKGSDLAPISISRFGQRFDDNVKAIMSRDISVSPDLFEHLGVVHKWLLLGNTCST